MKRVYVAGAYSDDNVLGVLRNIGRGEYYSSMLFMQGFSPFVPWFDKHYVISNFNVNFSVEQFQRATIQFLEVCDAVFVVPNHEGLKNWQYSSGVKEELKRAREFKIPIFYRMKDIVTWDNETKRKKK